MKYFILFLLALSFPLKASSQLAMPIDPTGQNKDWWIWTYVNDDLDTSSTAKPWNFKCSSYAYNWHGIVFVLKNLQTMDKGIPVLAAANGKVVSMIDTFADRSKNSSIPDHGNYIRVEHNPQLYTYYGFLKQHSLLVKNNQTVKKGDTIAMVGSSGPAYEAKLYFRTEGAFNNNYFDPLGSECTSVPYTAILNPAPLFDTSFGLIDVGVMNSSAVTTDTIIERPPTVKEISVTDDAFVCVWTQVKNSYTGDFNEHIWIKPDGNIFHRAQWTETNDSHIGYPRSWQPTYNLDTGIWTVKCLFNGDTITTQTFHVVEQHSGVTQNIPIPQTTIFPQSAKDHVTISGIRSKTAHLYDIEGIEHPTRFEQFSDGLATYWKDLPKGMYYISIMDEKGLLHRAKIMVTPE